MFKLSKVVPLIVFLLLVTILVRGLQLNPKDIPSARIGTKVPHLSKLETMNKKVYLLHFWATWCDTCMQESIFLEKVKMTLVGVLYKDSMIDFKNWKKTHQDIYKVLIHDKKGRLGLEMGVVATPETFVIDKHGVVRYRYQGPLTGEVIKNNIKPLVQKLEVES